MIYDYSKLLGKIKEKCSTQANFANALGIGRTSLNQRLNNILEFSQSEIDRAVEVLKFDKSEIPDYFFEKKVQKDEQDGER